MGEASGVRDDRGEDVVIRCRAVTKFYGDQVILDGVDLDIRRGETMVIMGGSGSGKSTTLRLMIGAEDVTAGTIELLGEDICDRTEDEMNVIRKRIGILFQSGALFNSMTLAENVALPLREHTELDHSIIDTMVTIKLELVGLREHADKYPAEISGGMKKRAGLARALAMDPDILFYDEPSAGLDPVTSAQIDRLIRDLSGKLGVTSVVVTHEMDSAFAIADRMAMLDKGRILRVGDRAWFDDLRRREDDAGLSVDERIVRQFLRGDAEGPLADRRDQASYIGELFGDPYRTTSTPSLQPTRE